MAIEIQSKVFFNTSAVAQHPFTEAFVEPGYTLCGGGAWLDYEEPGNLLYETYPIQIYNGSWTGWRVHGKDAWWASNSTITAYAIGIKVTRDGQPVNLEQTVFKSAGLNAELPAMSQQDGWIGTGGGTMCEQNIFENLFISETSPPRTCENDAGDMQLTSWFSAKQYCSSPTSNGKPTGGGEITTYLIAIRATGTKFRTKIYYQNSEFAAHPATEVSANGEVVVSGGAINNFRSPGSGNTSVNMLTGSYPAFEDPTKITGWKAVGKDQHYPSPSVIRACVVTLSAEDA